MISHLRYDEIIHKLTLDYAYYLFSLLNNPLKIKIYNIKCLTN